MNEEKSAIERACDLLGGTGALAEALKIKAPTVSQWRTGVRPVPTERCPAIEKATAGAVTCEQLRPDVDWAFLRGGDVPRETSASADPKATTA